MLAKVYSCALLGIEGIPLEIEVDLSGGLPAFELIGLPDPAVREARERVRSAIKNSGFEFPLRRITVNLAPADLKKEGTGFDLAIAVGILVATGQIPQNELLKSTVLVGELSLEGTLRPVPGALAIAASVASNRQLRGYTICLPEINSTEAALISAVTVIGIRSLKQLTSYLCHEINLPVVKPSIEKLLEPPITNLDFSEVRGQETAKRALEVAAAGAHNILLYGPPGSGKTMLARRLPTILPSPALDEMLEITRIHSVAGCLAPHQPLVTCRPFRTPHHSASAAGIIGGGKIPRPGEVSLAHRGVLFLDELPEYNRNILEALRQPLEDRRVTVTRVSASLTYPCDFMLVASMNPCPCGNFGDPIRECRCNPSIIQRYRSRLSGPLLDRIDIQIEVPRVKYDQLEKDRPIERSPAIRNRVKRARQRQEERFKNLKILTNSQMSSRQTVDFCPLSSEAKDLLRRSYQQLGLSMRAHDRLLKVARTIADLEGAETIKLNHIAEAIQYRSLDRQPEI
ncbi:MAG: YifB family Mg chelatase-like AAA ATPase [Firmicutes bacterium]|nr:YifB family Mg chelatase-like AAA ATPase [Bacillota bacterium]